MQFHIEFTRLTPKTRFMIIEWCLTSSCKQTTIIISLINKHRRRPRKASSSRWKLWQSIQTNVVEFWNIIARRGNQHKQDKNLHVAPHDSHDICNSLKELSKCILEAQQRLCSRFERKLRSQHLCSISDDTGTHYEQSAVEVTRNVEYTMQHGRWNSLKPKAFFAGVSVKSMGKMGRIFFVFSWQKQEI